LNGINNKAYRQEDLSSEERMSSMDMIKYQMNGNQLDYNSNN